MKKKSAVLAVLALAAMPSLAAAMCSEGHTPVQQTTAQCAAGQVWDAKLQACVAALHG